MEASSLYLIASAVVGAAQTADGILLLRANGSITKAFAAFAFVEYIWAGVSLSAFKAGVPSWLPASFVAYTVTGVILGVALAARANKQQSTAAFSAPRWFVLCGLAFGVYFCIASASVLLWA